VSTRAFDRSRAPAGHPDVPSAKRIAARLKLTWADVKTLALDPARPWEVALGQHLGAGPLDPPSAEEATGALQLVARRLDLNTLTPDEYDAERLRMRARERRSWRHGSPLELPTANQIVVVCGGWGNALAAAGLELRAADPLPAGGVPIVDALAWAVALHNAVPTTQQLEWFAGAQRFPLAKRRHPWAHYLDALAARLAEQGKELPPRAPAGRKASFHIPVEGAESPWDPSQYGVKRTKRHTREVCVEALVDFLDGISADERPTLRRYRQFRKEYPGKPASSVIDRHGGLVPLLEEARAVRRLRCSDL
jgi:hypothetical protein